MPITEAVQQRYDVACNTEEATNDIEMAFFDALRPPPRMTVVEHAEKTLYLSERTSAIPGLIKFNLTPYLVLPLVQFTNPRITRIYCCFGTQIGKTTIQMAILNFIIDYAPGPTLLCYPSQETAKQISKDRWQRLFDDCESLKRHKTGIANDFQLLQYTLDRMTVHISWNAMASVSSHPKKYVLKDETKDVDPEINTAADDRTKNFYGRKIVEVSSPLHPKDNIWTGLGLARDYEAEQVLLTADDVPGVRLPLRRWKPGTSTSVFFYYVPCPQCGHMQQLYPDRIRWPRDCAIRDLTYRAHYLCESCNFQIQDHHKPEMLRKGEWRSPNEGSSEIGFFLPSLYSAMGETCTFGEIAARYLRTHKYPARFAAFVNGYFAWPYEEEEFGHDAISMASIIEHSSADGNRYMRNQVPDDVLMLTAGADVGLRQIHYEIWGWGGDERERDAWLIAWDTLDVNMDVNSDGALEALEAVKEMKFKSGNRELSVVAMGIDSGYKTEEIYQWCQKHKWMLPLKGQRGQVRVPDGMEQYILKTTPLHKTPKGKTLRGGLLLRQSNTGLIKRELYDNLLSGRYKVPVDADQDILSQLNSEKIVARRNARTGVVQRFYTPKKMSDDDSLETTKNHYLDAAVINRALLEVLAAGMSVKQAAQKYAPRAPMTLGQIIKGRKD